MVEVVHDYRMARLRQAIGQFVIHKGTAIFDRQLLCLLLKVTEIAPITLLIDGLIQVDQVWILFMDVV